MHVNGKVCFVTGAASGIDETVARAFAEAGARGLTGMRRLRDKVYGAPTG